MTSQIQQVKEATDIVAVIGERMNLQRSGRNMRGLCPFHSEKSPSFFVSPDLQVFRCFGCGERGDVLTFLQKYEGMTFSESLELLAEKAGIKLERYQKSAEDDTREKMLEVLDLAKEYYHFLLTKHEVGQTAREYLKNRKTTSESIKLFQIGYSLPSWDGLIKYLVRKKKYDIKILEQAGLVIERNGKYYDRFRGRIMFPLTDHRGRIVGFSGRVLEADVKEAKYINTPETLLYHKSKMLFGFSQHYQSIREAKQVIVVEGEFDVISSDQAHVSNIVAIKGSALTKEHVELLRRTIDTIVLSLDADSAGIQATKRAIQIIQQFDDMRLRVLPSYLFHGKDPDDLARENPHAWREATKQSISVYQFLIDVAFRQNDESTGEGKQQIVNEVGPVLNMILHAVEKQHYVSVFAKRLGVPEAILQQDLLRLRTGRELSKEKETSQEKKSVDPATQIEQSVLSTALQLPEKEVVLASKELQSGEFTIPAHRIIIAALQQSTTFHLSQFVKTLAPEVAEAASNLYFANVKEQPSTLKEFHEVVQRFKTFQTQGKMKGLSDQLKQLESKPELTPEEEVKMNQLLEEIVASRGKG